MKWGFILLALLMTGCVPPIYDKTTYGIDEFIEDSHQIAQGKSAILALEAGEPPECITEALKPNQEVIIEGDELSIFVMTPHRPDRNALFTTLSERARFQVVDGQVTLPFVGSIEVVGLTLLEARKKIQLAYQEEILETQVMINFKKKHQRHVQIVGGSVSSVVIDQQSRLSDIIARAHPSPTTNLFKSYVQRGDQMLPIDLYRLIHEGDETQNIYMQNGDQLFFAQARDASIMVMGQVSLPIVIPIPYGFISIREALAIANGIPFTGDKKQIIVIRGGMTRPKIYSLSWCEILHTQNNSLLLMPGDVVYVPERPITQWNLFISQLLPSINCFNSGCGCYQIIP
jgi:polysaccharide export outer membrane protein